MFANRQGTSWKENFIMQKLKKSKWSFYEIRRREDIENENEKWKQPVKVKLRVDNEIQNYFWKARSLYCCQEFS